MSEHPEAIRFVQALDAWLREQPIQDLVPRETLVGLIQEGRDDEALWTDARPRFDRAWAWIEDKVRSEERPLRDVLSAEACERFLDGLERVEPDPDAVRAFLRSPAIEHMLGEVLYHGISEFLRKADFVGRIVNRLPVIGPIRKKIMGVFKEEFEGRLEEQIKGFLGQFSGRAVDRMIEHVLSEQNRAGFSAARRKVGEHVLSRPVKTLIPSGEATGRARDQLWGGLRKAALREEETLLEQAYEDHGADPWSAWAWPLTERSTELLAATLARFLASGNWKLEG
ncbi:MAG: hypothetical protein JKY65_09070 [Planctomycetes bacterium]|nr:hypothetical protein [Planctomycetota bacterium]